MDSVQIDSALYVIGKDYFALAGLMSLAGKPIVINEGEIVVSSAIAILLGIPKEEIIGYEVRVSPTFQAGFEGGILDEDSFERLKEPEKKSFVISDVIDDDLSAFVYALEGSFKTISPDYFAEAKVKVRKDEFLGPLKEDLIAKGYIISSISDTVEETKKIFRGIQVVLGFFGLIALIIASIGMLNIMTIVLLERTQEIGIMKAIGASNVDIWKIVISDAVIIGFLGGLGGAIIGVGTAELFNFAFNLLARRIGGMAVEIFQMPPGFILIIVAFSAVMGFITGVWPAIRASRISPLEAIRYK
jgi:putative ABC transport system permease protein